MRESAPVSSRAPAVVVSMSRTLSQPCGNIEHERGPSHDVQGFGRFARCFQNAATVHTFARMDIATCRDQHFWVRSGGTGARSATCHIRCSKARPRTAPIDAPFRKKRPRFDRIGAEPRQTRSPCPNPHTYEKGRLLQPHRVARSAHVTPAAKCLRGVTEVRIASCDARALKHAQDLGRQKLVCAPQTSQHRASCVRPKPRSSLTPQEPKNPMICRSRTRPRSVTAHSHKAG